MENRCEHCLSKNIICVGEEGLIRSVLPYYIADLYHPETLEIPCNELAYIVEDFLSRNDKIDKKVKEILGSVWIVKEKVF